MSQLNVPIPMRVKMLKTSAIYPFLLKDGLYIIPESYGRLLINREEADIALDLDMTREPIMFGDKRFLATRKGNASLSMEKKSRENADQPKKTSLFIDDNYMFEQVKRTNGTVGFIQYNFSTGEMNEVEIIDSNKEPLYPINDEEVAAGHIKLPSGTSEFGTEENLINDIETHVKKYLDVPEEYLHYAALNVLKSWVYERYGSLNYLRVQGEPGTGKSRFLDVIGGLHYKPIATSGATTVAPVFRLINKWGCTLVMDEADLQKSDETNEMIKIINQGFEKGKPVLRCNPDDKSKVEFFNVYCPKVLSTRHVFDDIATESRCMTQIMTGSNRTNIIASLNDAFHAEQQELRNKLLLWRFKNFKRINPDIGETLDWSGIELRLKQVNIGFVSLIANDKPYIEKFMQKIRDKQMELRNERSETTEGHIVSACARIVKEDRPLLAKTIIDYADLTDQKGNRWKPRKIASYMKTLGFLGTKLQRIEGQPEKVYQYNDQVLAQLFRKYLTEDEFEDFVNDLAQSLKNLKICNHVTVVTIVTVWGKTAKTPVLPQNVTDVPPLLKDGYIGYTVTKDQLNLDKMVLNGVLSEIRPGIYEKVK